MSMTLSAKQLREALELCAPDDGDLDQLETEVTFFFREKDEISDEGEPMPRGWYCYLSEYPEDGCYGPLGAERKPGHEVVEAKPK